jgi:hypothetical protein
MLTGEVKKELGEVMIEITQEEPGSPEKSVLGIKLHAHSSLMRLFAPL